MFLNVDVLYQIFLYCDPRTFLNLSSISRVLFDLGSDTKLLKDYVLLNIGLENENDCFVADDYKQVITNVAHVVETEWSFSFFLNNGHYHLLKQFSVTDLKKFEFRSSVNPLSRIIRFDFINTFIWYNSIKPVSINDFIKASRSYYSYPRIIMQYFYSQKATEIHQLLKNSGSIIYSEPLFIFATTQMLINKHTRLNSKDFRKFVYQVYQEKHFFHQQCLCNLLLSDVYRDFLDDDISLILNFLQFDQVRRVFVFQYKNSYFDFKHFIKHVFLKIRASLDFFKFMLLHVSFSDLSFLFQFFFADDQGNHQVFRTLLIDLWNTKFSESSNASNDSKDSNLLKFDDFVNCFSFSASFLTEEDFLIWLHHYKLRFHELTQSHFNRICFSNRQSSCLCQLSRVSGVYFIDFFRDRSVEEFRHKQSWMTDLFKEKLHLSANYYTFGLGFWQNVFCSFRSPDLLSFFLTLPYSNKDKVKVFCYYHSTMEKFQKRQTLNFCFTKPTLKMMSQRFLKPKKYDHQKLSNISGLKNLIKCQPLLTLELFHGLLDRTSEKLAFLNIFMIKDKISNDFKNLDPSDVDHLFNLYFKHVNHGKSA